MSSSADSSQPPRPAGVDPRGLRFAAGATAVVLAVVLVTGSVWLLAAQTAVFAVAAVGGARRSPYGVAFVRLLRPRLGPPAEPEDPRPPRFAQAVGLAFAVVALAGFLTGATTVGLVATGFAFVAAFLNAAFGLCLGCELYLLIRRIVPTRSARSAAGTTTTEVSA